MKEDAPELHFPNYIEGDFKNPLDALTPWYSKGALKRLVQQKGIKISSFHNETWIKVGKILFIIVPSYHDVATRAQVWWTYHYEIMPKVLEWSDPE